MPDRPAANIDQPTLFLLLVAALAFLVRNRIVFAVVALPIAALAAGIAWLLDSDPLFFGWRNHWGWDFLFALVYAMFLDRWIKETLVEGAFPCEEVDNLRRSIIAPRFLFYIAMLFLLAFVLGGLPVDWIVGPHAIAPAALGQMAGTVLLWLPHLVFWSLVFAFFCLILPSLSAAEPLSLLGALRLGRRVRPLLVTLVLGTALISMIGYVATEWGQYRLPPKPWSTAAMTAVHRLFDCVLLTFMGYCLATLYRRLTGWQPPISEEHPYHAMGVRLRKAP
jgi:hypothetical protein